KKEAKKEPPPKVFAHWERLSVREKQVAAYAGSLAAPLNFAVPGVLGNPVIAELSLFGSLPLIAKVKDLKEPKQPDRFILGGDDYFLKVVVTTKGAGVQQLTFNERLTGFLAADSLGRPTDRPLSLVEDDPYYPSYLMYHYPKGYAAEPDKEGAKTPPSPA